MNRPCWLVVWVTNPSIRLDTDIKRRCINYGVIEKLLVITPRRWSRIESSVPRLLLLQHSNSIRTSIKWKRSIHTLLPPPSSSLPSSIRHELILTSCWRWFVTFTQSDIEKPAQLSNPQPPPLKKKIAMIQSEHPAGSAGSGPGIEVPSQHQGKLVSDWTSSRQNLIHLAELSLGDWTLLLTPAPS